MLDPLKVDGLAYDPEERAVVMLLTDALGWDDELAHLSLLQGKLNAYAAFVEGRQYERLMPGAEVDRAVIDLSFAAITEKCWELVQAVAAQLNDELGIVISLGYGREAPKTRWKYFARARECGTKEEREEFTGSYLRRYWYASNQGQAWWGSHKRDYAGTYKGYWAFDIAAVARAWGLDDSSFADFKYYPKDLARYLPR